MKWTPKDLEIVRQHYSSGDTDPMELSRMMGRTVASIKCKAYKLGVAASVKIEEEDEAYIKSLEGINNISDVSKKMGRCWNTVKKIIVKLGLEDRYSPPNSLWEPSEEEINLMRSRMTLKQLSAKMDRSEATILKKIRQMDIHRLQREKKEQVKREPRIKKEKKIVTQAPRSSEGENRIREAMERINKI